MCPSPSEPACQPTPPKKSASLSSLPPLKPTCLPSSPPCPPPKPSCSKPDSPCLATKTSCTPSKHSYSTLTFNLKAFSTEGPCPPSKPLCPPSCPPPDHSRKKKSEICQKRSACPRPKSDGHSSNPQKAKECRKKPSCPPACPSSNPCGDNFKSLCQKKTEKIEYISSPPCPPPCCGINLNTWGLVDEAEKEYKSSREKKSRIEQDNGSSINSKN